MLVVIRGYQYEHLQNAVREQNCGIHTNSKLLMKLEILHIRTMHSLLQLLGFSFLSSRIALKLQSDWYDYSLYVITTRLRDLQVQGLHWRNHCVL